MLQRKPPASVTATASAPRAVADSTSSLSDVFGSQQQTSSLSLLGRVTNVRESAQCTGPPSAFFWPPRKTTASTIIHPSPDLEATSVGKEPPPISSPATAPSAKHYDDGNYAIANNQDLGGSTSNTGDTQNGSSAQPLLIPEPTVAKAKKHPVETRESESGRKAPPNEKEHAETPPETATLERPGLSGRQRRNKVMKGIETDEV
jgi:hypothetical protein